MFDCVTSRRKNLRTDILQVCGVHFLTKIKVYSYGSYEVRSNLKPRSFAFSIQSFYPYLLGHNTTINSIKHNKNAP